MISKAAVEKVERMVGAEVEGVERYPQDVKEDRPIRFFVSYAGNDNLHKKRFIEKLTIYLSAYRHARFELWTDGEILPGAKWLDEINGAMRACDFGLLLVSPSFLGNRFVVETELAYLLQNKPVIPIALKRVPFDGLLDLKGLEERQVYPSRAKAFAELRDDVARDRFVEGLLEKIHAILTARSKPEKPKFDHHLRSAVEDFDRERFVHTEGVPTTLSKGLDAAPEIDASRRKDAIEFLTEWIEDEKAPPYCALLGEYGMGKTTTCKALAWDLLQRREQGERAILPIYLDLRYVGESVKRELTLDEILELILRRSWKSGPDGSTLSAQELIKLAQNDRTVVIWDGLDEVLVHLGEHSGQMFTRQLFRILPPARKGETHRGRMLVSCRTHYFRTLRDQQTHFRAEDRDNVRAEDYRAPFVLLPFTEDQIRKYIAATLPEENTDRVMEVLSTVHNLKEMAQRPYTLSLIAQEFAQIERWKAEGRRVTGLMLYRHMVLSWLERDAGKHQITPDHKQRLMEHLAAEIWRAGAKSWSVNDLEQWLIDFLEAHPKVAAHYAGKARELLKEDLRTATFLVREGEDRFRFAHTSLQEYFLAGYLRRALLENRPEEWELVRVSRETLDFLGQWLWEDEASRPPALATLSRLRDTYRAQASELAFDYILLANRKGYPAPSAAGFQLPGADLTDWEIEGKAGTPLMLARINLRGARLWRSRWKHCNLQGAVFDGADAMRAEWLECHLPESSWRAASLEATIFRDCELSKANFQHAKSRRTQRLRCRLAGAMGLPAEGLEARYALCHSGPEESVRDLPGGARLTTATGHFGSVNACAWSPDGLRIVSASDDQTLRIWDAISGACLATLAGHSDPVRGCAWSPDGLRIVSASADQTLRIWDALSSTCPAILAGHSDWVNACSWSPDGLRIVSASTDQTLRIWDAFSSACLATLAGHSESVLACAWSPDGLRILSASTDQTLRIWDAFSGACLATLAGHSDWVNACSWSPDGLRIVSASTDQTLRIWDAFSSACLATLAGHSESVLACAWSPDGLRIVSSSGDQTLRISDAISGACLATLAGHSDSVNACAWSSDGLRIVSASSDKTLRIWDAISGACLATLAGHPFAARGCGWSPDGRSVLSASDDHTLHRWDAISGACLATLTGHSGSVNACAWSPDGLRIISASEDETLRVWDALSGNCLVTLVGHSGSVNACAWSGDRLRIVSASSDKTLRIWDAISGNCLTTFAVDSDSVWGCTWSPDGLRIVSASCDETLRIWDAISGNCLDNFGGHTDYVLNCAWSPDGLRIVSASTDQTLRLWDVLSGACLATLAGHSDWVSACAWSPNGLRIVSASYDQTLRIWDAFSGACLATLAGHSDSVNACSWSPDGLRILSASRDGTVRIWDSVSGIERSPRIYHLWTPHGDSTWCAIDHQNNRILACDREAWRCLGWLITDPATGSMEMLPAETFGALPFAEP